jgi:phosphoglucomutase
MAAGGLMAAAMGSSFAQDPNASKTVKSAGTAAAVAGTGLMLASLIDAVEVQKEREKWINLTRAFYHHYYGGIDADESERPAPPALPEVPFTFKDPEPADDEP